MWLVFSIQCKVKFLQLTKADTICVLSCSTPKASLLAQPDLQRASTCRLAPLTAPVAAPSLPQHSPSTEHSELKWPKPLLHFGAGPGVAQTSRLQGSRLPARGSEVEHFSGGGISYSLASVHARIKACRYLNSRCSEH